MNPANTIVCVSASFAEGDELQAMLNKYARHTDGHFACWGTFAFTAKTLPECDALLIFNSPSRRLQTRCDPGKVIAFMMEPGFEHEHPWMFRSLEQYAQIFSPVSRPGTVLSHGYLGWYPPENYSSLVNSRVPAKTKMISCISSGLSRLPGHRDRLAFINELSRSSIPVDLFGRPARFIENKMEGLLPYRYSIAMENTSRLHYFTEKINDCFLAYTIPVYYGCRNIGRYFPERSFIQIDIKDPCAALKKINSIIENDDWENRLAALEEARRLVLEKYQPLAGAANILAKGQPLARKDIVLDPVRRSLTDRIQTLVHRRFPRPGFFHSPGKRESQPT